MSVGDCLVTVKINSENITAHLGHGRVVSVPLAWFLRLSEANPAQRSRFEIIGDGQRVHWPAVDEDIGVEGMRHGIQRIILKLNFISGTFGARHPVSD